MTITSAQAGSSPHTRGARRVAGAREVRLRIIPAYAGSTRLRSTVSRSPRDHPRIRGEHLSGEPAVWSETGSSPHTRGAPMQEIDIYNGLGIIPAYAGSTVAPPRRRARKPDHPRIRGEHLLEPAWRRIVSGSSPHTRGARRFALPYDVETRIIPAYAGSTAIHAGECFGEGDHPRIRGEHVRLGRDREAGGGIIPAYAGSTGAAR